MSRKLDIQTAIVNLIRDWNFPVVEYDDQSSLPSFTGKFDSPRVHCNEVSSKFLVDGHYKRGIRLQRGDWAFAAIVRFSQEVSVEEFEDHLAENVPVLPAVPEENKLSAQIFLVQTSPIHPVMQENVTGTKVTFAFVVRSGKI